MYMQKIINYLMTFYQHYKEIANAIGIVVSILLTIPFFKIIRKKRKSKTDIFLIFLFIFLFIFMILIGFISYKSLEYTIVPNVVGTNYEVGCNILSQNGLKCQNFTITKPKNTIIYQSENANSFVKKGTVIEPVFGSNY